MTADSKKAFAKKLKELRAKNDVTQQELADIILQVAAGEKGYEDLLAWLLTHQL